MKKYYLISYLLSLSLFASAQDFQFGASTAPDGQTFKVDSHGFKVNDRYVIPVMGEMHYSRVQEKEWRREIQKMKAGGITTLATYVFWIHHEAEEGKWDWSGNKNLRKFIETCKEEHMPVVLRIGPFCHGEVYQGGFPVWLAQKASANPKEYKLRSQAPGFIAATRSLYTNIYKQVEGLLWKDGGPIVGVQIENECRGPWGYYMQLKDMAVEIGFDTPFYTRTGWPKLNGKEEFGKLLPLYGDYADGFWDRTLNDMPGAYKDAFIMKDDRMSRVIATETFTKEELSEKTVNANPANGACSYPYLTCELGGGMMPSYHRRINMSGYEAFPLALCKVGSGSNLPGYYMYHGGSNPYNPEHTMAETQATSVTNYNDMPYMTYDFQAPLGEMGQLNENAFHQTRWFHQFLADWGEELCVMDVDTLSEKYARRGCFEFRNSYVRILNETGITSVCPKEMQWEGLTISSDRIQPFAKADGQLYFITARPNAVTKNMKKFFDNPLVNIDGAVYKLKLDKPFRIKGKTITVLSPEKARKAYVIDGKMRYSDGILYKSGDKIMEETWNVLNGKIDYVLTKEHGGLRTVSMGSQKVAAMPVDADFDKAAVWTINGISQLNENLNLFLQIDYKGDAARVYADGRLVQDNFWNGKPMLVRVSDLVDKKVELRILPLGKDFPIYLQKEQRAILDAAPEGVLISLDSIKVLECRDEEVED